MSVKKIVDELLPYLPATASCRKAWPSWGPCRRCRLAGCCPWALTQRPRPSPSRPSRPSSRRGVCCKEPGDKLLKVDTPGLELRLEVVHGRSTISSATPSILSGSLTRVTDDDGSCPSSWSRARRVRLVRAKKAQCDCRNWRRATCYKSAKGHETSTHWQHDL